MPKRGYFRKDYSYRQIDPEMASRAFAGLYALHGHLFKKEKAAKIAKIAKANKKCSR